MTDNMIERVARKLMAVAIGAGVDSRGIEWTEFEHDARDLLSAIREPTDSVLLAGTSALPGHSSGSYAAKRIVYAIHTTMIDAALAECPN